MKLFFLMFAILISGAPPLFAQDKPNARTEDTTPRRIATAGYTLALSWTPEYCHGARRAASDECALASAKGFTLHGLWPDGADPKLWPQYCRTASPLTAAQLRLGAAATPSPRLLQHEWAKHGSCMAADPSAYFAEEQRIYRGVHSPDMRALAARHGLTARQVQQVFADANPGMTADMVRLNLNRRGWLEEVWLCLGLDKRPRHCPTEASAPAIGAPVRVQAPG